MVASGRGATRPRCRPGVHPPGGGRHSRLLDLPAARLALCVPLTPGLLGGRRGAEVRRLRQLRKAAVRHRPAALSRRDPPANARRYRGLARDLRPVRRPPLSVRARPQPHSGRACRPRCDDRNRRGACLADRQYDPDERPSRHSGRDDRLRRRRRVRPVPARARPRFARGPAPPRPALLPRGLPAADDDHARRRCVPVPDAHGYEQGTALSAVGPFRIDRRVLGHKSLGRAAGGDDRRRMAVDAVHLHRLAGCDRDPAPCADRSGGRRRREPLANLLEDHVSADPSGDHHGGADSHHRRLQDRRPAQCPDQRRAWNRHRIADPSRLHHLASAGHRWFRGGCLHAADRRDLRRHLLRQPVPPSGDGDGVSAMAIIRRRRGSVSTTTVPFPAMTLSYIALFAWTFVVLFPLYWLAVTALKTPLDVNGGPFYVPWRDFQPTLDSWHYIFFDLREDTFRPYLNTVVVGLTSTAITVLLGSMAAYGLVRMRYRVGLGAIGSFAVAVAITVVVVIAGGPWPLGVAAGTGVFVLLLH